MAQGDIKILQQSSMTGRGARKYNVGSGTDAILPGEPVARALGAVVVTPMGSGVSGSSGPYVTTDYLVGVAATSGTQTATADGSVYAYPLTSQTTYIMAANDSTDINTQAKYDALVGARVLMDYTTGTYTLLVGDEATAGCVILPLDITRYPGKIAFAFREGVSDLS